MTLEQSLWKPRLRWQAQSFITGENRSIVFIEYPVGSIKVSSINGQQKVIIVAI